MNPEERQAQYIRTIHKTSEYEMFYASLTDKIKSKFDYVLNVVATVYNLSIKFVKHLENTDLYEMRVSVGTNEYRTILFAMDHNNIIEAENILLLNGFLKKDNRDYKRQIKIAENILKGLEL